MEVRIVRLKNDEQYRELQQVQKQAWGTDNADLVPKHLLIAIQNHGGLVLGAYDDRERMVGMLLGVCASSDGKLYHYSHMNGVIPSCQHQGIGYRLKLRQREEVLKQGIELIVWTFDPLQSVNAKININKLGTICNTYKRNFYGSMDDALNLGKVSDRFLVEWWIKSDRVRRRIHGSEPQTTTEQFKKEFEVITKTKQSDRFLLELLDYDLSSDSEKIAVEIPENITELRKRNEKAASRWRMATREILESYFAKKYWVTDFLSNETQGGRQNFYLLQRNYRLG